MQLGMESGDWRTGGQYLGLRSVTETSIPVMLHYYHFLNYTSLQTFRIPSKWTVLGRELNSYGRLLTLVVKLRELRVKDNININIRESSEINAMQYR
jgi:hypothetical protein